MSARPLHNHDALCSVLYELDKCKNQFKPFNSVHEAYGVLAEEVDELWDEIKKKECDKARIKAEAVQVAAVAIRLIEDLT